MGVYIPKHFALEEWVPPSVFDRRGELAWELLDPRALKTADAIREETGKSVIINTWHKQSLIDAFTLRQHSGFRDEWFYIEELADGDYDEGVKLPRNKTVLWSAYIRRSSCLPRPGRLDHE